MQVVGASEIAFSAGVMNGSVDFDDEAMGVAIEVNYETADGVLPAELEIGDSSVAEVMPQEFFSRGHLSAELPCPMADFAAGWMA